MGFRFPQGRARTLAPLAALAVIACSAAVASCERGGPGPEFAEDDEPLASSGPCGVERWSVKVLTDSAASAVNFAPQDTTIAGLRTPPAPASLGSGTARIAGVETTTYRLTNVTLHEYKLEADSDVHLVLWDPSSTATTMIGEIAAPACAAGSLQLTAITTARNAFLAAYPNLSTSFQLADVPVSLVGVGFFDILHGQTGVAPNGIELHTVLDICFGANCTLTFGGGTDGGAPDAGHPDAGAPDAGAPDAGGPDAGTADAGHTDAGSGDAGTPDAGGPDAGNIGSPDAGNTGSPDAGNTGSPDAGARGTYAFGGGCATGPDPAAWALLALAGVARRRRPRR